MRLRPIEPDSVAFAAFEGVLARAGLPTEDLLAEPARYFALGGGRHAPRAFAGLLMFGDDALVRSVVTAPWARGEGLARAVVTALVDLATADGVQRLWLLTTTAEAFFARHGWRRMDRDRAPAAIAASRQFSYTCPAFAVLMCRKLA